MHRKPHPLISTPLRKHCPVCGQVSYSVAGIHPQCCVRQADAKRMEKVQRTAKSRKPAKTGASLTPWQKRCPQCREIVHCRKSACRCGHNFVAAEAAAVSGK